ILAMVNSVGWVIAGFSLLAGGFGVANIMFVSVKERTHIIGIQKALGAKRHIILTQFLIEALLLCIAGGLLGILLAWGALLVWDLVMSAPQSGMFEIQLSGQNILTALVVSCVIGVLSGLAPAISAATMSPADAINSK
ncbi:MAG: FtsX-like permease family protein, partial [Alistipes sp.]|nr:FtsX-like permease family protein [Alistipes sp.]